MPVRSRHLASRISCSSSMSKLTYSFPYGVREELVGLGGRGGGVRVRRWHLVVKERKDEWRRKRFCESVYKRRKSESSIASMRDEMGHQCPVRPSQLVYPPAVLGRKGTRNPSPLSALSRMRKRCARCDGDAVALERAPWTLVQEWGERVTCLVVTRSKLNGLVSLLYEHYGRSAGVKRSLIWSCV